MNEAPADGGLSRLFTVRRLDSWRVSRGTPAQRFDVDIICYKCHASVASSLSGVVGQIILKVIARHKFSS